MTQSLATRGQKERESKEKPRTKQTKRQTKRSKKPSPLGQERKGKERNARENRLLHQLVRWNDTKFFML